MVAGEIELKLALEPADLKRLTALPAIAGHRQGRAHTAELASTYYDTPDLALAKAGITVRVRATGREILQTVKTAGDRTAGLFSRGEWEAPIAIAQPDHDLLRATKLAPLQDHDVLDRLAPVFMTEVRRTTHRLVGPEWEVELALDRGTVRASGLAQPISEAELELVRGAPACLFHLGRIIVESVPARLMTLSKSDRGYALAAGTTPMPAKATAVDLEPDMTVAAAFQAIARNCLHQILVNERALPGSDGGEAIHQMRVALRRLRSAIKVFRPIVAGPQLDGLRREIGWLLSQLGPARDGHVFMTEIIDPVVEHFPDNPALAGLRTRWAKTCETDYRAALDAVASRRFNGLMLDLGAWVEAGDWLDDPARHDRKITAFATDVLAKFDKKLRNAGGRDLTRRPPGQLHRVRILGKQLRYAGEFFAALFPSKATREHLRLVAALQDELGALNDIAVAGTKLAAGTHDGDGAWCAGLVTGWHQARRPALLKQAAAAWRKRRKAERFWKP